MLFVLIPLISIIGRAADNFTDCFGACNLCDQQDLTQCSNKPNSCLPGFYYSAVNASCIVMPAFNLFANDTVLNGKAPSGWKVIGGEDTAKSMSCSTIKNQQNISLVGPFTNEPLTKTFKIATSSFTIVSLFLLRMNWTTEDKLTITIQDDSNILRTEEFNLTSLWSENLTRINYWNNCENFPKATLNGKQLSYVLGGDTSGNLIVTFQPSISSSQARWAFTNIIVMTGCNNFMLSIDGGLCNSCPSGYYYNSTLLECRQCHSYCQSCLSGGPDGCLSCPTMSVFNGFSCKFSSNFNFVFDNITLNTSAAQNISSCGTKLMLGGPKYGKVGSLLSRKLSLPKHAYLKVEFSLIRVGLWEGYSLTLFVNGQQYLQITEFNQASISPLCAVEIGPILCAQVRYRSDFRAHRNMSVLLEWKLTGPNNTAIVYGIRNIKLTYYTCPKQCATCLLQANLGQKCESCNPFLTTSSNCLECPNGFFKQTTNESIFCQKCHVMCKNCNSEQPTNCTECYQNFRLSNGYCEVNGDQGFVPFSKDLTPYNWLDSNFIANSPKAGTFKCGNYRLFGVADSTSAITITRNYKLPAHSGLIIMLNVFKLGRWVGSNNNITVALNSEVFVNIAVNGSSGSTVCEGSNKDFIYTFYRYFTGHVRSEIILTVTAGGGVGIRDINILLKDCPECSTSQLMYSLEYMPVYTLDNSSIAINTWLKFNKHIIDPQSIQNSFRVIINNQPVPITQTEFLYDLRLLTPLNFSFVNGTMQVQAVNPQSVLSLPEESIIRRRLLAPISATLDGMPTSTKLVRYDILTEDEMEPSRNIHRIFSGATAAVLYPSICLVGLGLGLAVQEFVMALQLVFMQIYVNSHELPASLKLSLEGMTRIEHLNYFTDGNRRAIEAAILPNNHHQRSPHIFEQYHTDITFMRGVYPILFLNIIYILYYVLVGVLYCSIKSLAASQNLIARWFRQIAERPFNFFDGIIRWQYITTAWIAICQLRNMHVSHVKAFEGFNNFLTVLCIIWVGLYPFFIAIYLYRVRKVILKDSFSLNYEDVFYKRIKKSQDEYDSFIYVTVRFLRLLLCTLFTALLAQQQIAAPLIILLLTLLEIIYILSKEIYLDRMLLLFKVLEAVGFVVLEIIYIVMWAQSDKWSTHKYLGIGFFADSVILFIMTVCLLRTLYYCYSKLKDFYRRNKNVVVQREGRVKTIRIGATHSHIAHPEVTNHTTRSIRPGSPTSMTARQEVANYA